MMLGKGPFSFGKIWMKQFHCTSQQVATIQSFLNGYKEDELVQEILYFLKILLVIY